MPHVDVLLTHEQARFLGKRAKAIDSTPRAVLQALISRVLQEALAGRSHEGSPTVQAGFAAFAEQYAAATESLGQPDPELRVAGSPERPATDGVQSSTERAEGGPSGPLERVDLADGDLQRAFAEFERDYRDISEQLFGDDAAFSAHLPDRHFYAFAVTIPREAESEGEPLTVAQLLDRLPPADEVEPALSRYIAHLAVASDDQLDGPAIIYPQPRPGTPRPNPDA